jgi:PAS domain S-box-containing protein
LAIVLHNREFMYRGFERDDLMVVLEGIEDAVVKLDGQAHFVAMNQAAIVIYQRLGLDAQDMKGKSVWDVFPELKGTIVERELRLVIEEHVQVNFEFCFPKDQHWYETKGYSVPPGAVLVFRDITDKKSGAQ